MHIYLRAHYTYLLFIVFLVSETQAATITSAQSGNWDTGSTWVGGVAPGAADNAIIASGHTVTLVANATITGFTINTGGTLSDAGFRLTITANLVINGTWSGNGNGRLIMTGASATIGGTGTINDADRLDVQGGNKTVLATADLTFTGTNQRITFAPSSTMTNSGVVTLKRITGTGDTGTWVNAVNSALNVSEQLLPLGTLTATASGNTINYNGTGIAQTVKPTTYHHLVINKTGQTATLGGNTIVNGNLTVTAGTFNPNGFSLSAKGNFTNNGAYTTSTSVVTFNGTSNQTIGGGTPTTFASMTVNNASGATIGTSATVSDTLTMTSGNIATGSNTLTLGTSTAALGTLSRTSGTIIGNFRRWFAGATVSNVLFPTGTATNYRPANISFTSAPTVGGTLTASFTASNPGTNGLPLNDAGTNIVNCGVDGFWTLTGGNGLMGGTYSLDLTADGFAGVSDFTTLRILKRANAFSAWTLDGTHSPGTGSNSIPIAHRTGMSGFSDFGIGGASDNPLPIQLLSFTAMVVDQNQVELEWVTLSELNNYGFLVDKSPDQPNAFQTIPNSFVPGHGTTNVPQYYSYTDTAVGQGKWYYRLKQIDTDGTIHFTQAIGIDVLTSVQEGEIPHAFALHQNYPNPFNPSTTVSYQLPSKGHVTLKVYDVLSREVATLVNGVEEPGYKLVQWDGTGVASGLYFYRLQAGEFTRTKRLLLLR